MLRLAGRLRNRFRLRHRPQERIARLYPKFLEAERDDIAATDGPRISVLLPVYNPPLPYLRAAILSVRNQLYRNWELCIVDDASPGRQAALMIADMAGEDRRIKRARLATNAGIAGATNAALAMATGVFVALLDHDDELPPRALACIAAELARHPETDLVFSDEDQLVQGRRCAPYFKPGWNPDLVLSQNLVSHLGVYRRSLVERLGGLRQDFAGSQDYDLALRAIAVTGPGRIRHVPEILYHWRQHPDSFSARRAAQCQTAARAALAAHLGDAATAEPNPDIPQWTRLIHRLPDPAPLVSIVLPAGATAPDASGYEPFELIRDDIGTARGEVLVFFARDVAVVRPGWLRELVSQALRQGVGCVGSRLDGPDRRILNSGYTLHPDVIVQTLAPRSDPADPGYSGHFVLCRTVAAVARTGMAVRRSIFTDFGGFDARAGTYADVDLCLRLAEQGFRTVWTPHARLRHRTIPRRRADAAGAAHMRARWGETLAHDPYANPNLIIDDGNLALADRRADPAKRPETP